MTLTSTYFPFTLKFLQAHVQSTAIQEYNYRLSDLTRRLNALRARVNNWEQKSTDLEMLAGVVWKADDTVTALEEIVKPKLAAVRDIGLRCRLILEVRRKFDLTL